MNCSSAFARMPCDSETEIAKSAQRSHRIHPRAWPTPGILVILAHDQPPEFCAILGRYNAGRVVGESSQDRNFMAVFYPIVGKFSNPRRWRSHLRRKILRYVEDFHVHQ